MRAFPKTDDEEINVRNASKLFEEVEREEAEEVVLRGGNIIVGEVALQGVAIVAVAMAWVACIGGRGTGGLARLDVLLPRGDRSAPSASRGIGAAASGTTSEVVAPTGDVQVHVAQMVRVRVGDAATRYAFVRCPAAVLAAAAESISISISIAVDRQRHRSRAAHAAVHLR